MRSIIGHFSRSPIRFRLRSMRAGGPGRPVDRFILARLEAKGLSPSPRADERTLIRRATFDLIGPAPDTRRSRRVRGRHRSGRIRTRDRSAAGLAALRRAMGAILARRGPLCRHQGIRPVSGRQFPLGLYLSRLCHRRLQSRPALRPIPDRTDRGRPACRPQTAESRWRPWGFSRWAAGSWATSTT